jgi:Asp-tRNA(Asn)/Glu-tRNA(Gln) amidotransferase A subunit family amidase
VGDPLSYPLDPASFLMTREVDLGALRVGWTEDFGACDVDPGIRETFRRKLRSMKHLFRSCAEVKFDLGDVHRCFDVLRAEAFVAATRDAYARDPGSLGPNTRANYEIGAAMSLLDSAWAQAVQTRILARFNAAMAGYDVILAPTTPLTPFPWTTLHADTIAGKPQANYYRWLALTYIVTLATLPALSLPCGVDHAGMPFGLQLVGHFRADHHVLGVAAALEQAFAGSEELRRPLPRLDALQAVEPALTSLVSAPPGAQWVRPFP